MSTEVTVTALHQVILNQLLCDGYAPDIEQLAAHFGHSDREMVRRKLLELEAGHGVVLHPNREKVWIIHPLSTAPTNFTVNCQGKVHWGNCAWCSFGVAALLKPADVKIATTSGAEGQPIELEIRNGKLTPNGSVVHFPVPMANAWDNVVYTCSVMLLFRNNEEVDSWCYRHHVPRGDVQPVEKIWAFSQEWYGNHLSPNWKKWTNEEAAQIFSRHGLTGPIWEIPKTPGRF